MENGFSKCIISLHKVSISSVALCSALTNIQSRKRDGGRAKKREKQKTKIVRNIQKRNDMNEHG